MKFVLSWLVWAAVGVWAVDYNALVPIPSYAGRNQNGLTYLRQSTMLDIFGRPCSLSTNCQSISRSNTKLYSLIETRDVGPFRVTGLKPALSALQRAFSKLRREKPDLYNALSTAGMVCCRAVRGSSSSWSNHAFGAALDIKINGRLDPRADGKTQRGLLELFPYLAAEGFYWAAGYSPRYEDAMHFEVADQTIRSWNSAGLFGSSSGGGSSGGGGSGGSATGVGAACRSPLANKGVCLDTTKTSSRYGCQWTSGKCPGGSNIRCCTTLVEDSRNEGFCLPVSQCSGRVQSGLCPGPSGVKACLAYRKGANNDACRAVRSRYACESATCTWNRGYNRCESRW